MKRRKIWKLIKRRLLNETSQFFTNRRIFYQSGFFRIFMTVFEIFVVLKGAQVLDLCNINRYILYGLYNWSEMLNQTSFS